MRRPIDTAPRSGDDIWVEDATGAVEVGHWSPEAGKWVWQDGSPIEPAPTHWYLVAEDVDPEDEKSGGSLVVAAILIPAVFVAASLFGVFTPFTAQPTMTHIGAESTLSLDAKPEISTGSPALLQREATGVLMQAEPASVVPPRQRLDEDAPRIEALVNELAEAHKELAEAVQRTQTADIAAEELRKSLQQEQAHSAKLANELAGASREIDAGNARSRQADEVAAQQRDAAAREVAELQQSLQQERQRSGLLVKQANAAQAAAANAEQERHEAQSRAAALASELAGIPRGSLMVEAAAAEQKEALGREVAELRQALQDERQKSADLLAGAKAAQAIAANAEQQRRALEEVQAHAAALARELAETHREIETRNVQLREANDAAAQQREAANREIAELRRSLQQERTGTEAKQKDRASTPADARLQVEQTNEGPILPAARSVEATAAEPLTAASQSEAEARLLPRARALLDQGNIGAARIVLELAAEKDIAQASFMLAETYDPAVLSAWGTYGTRGEAAKARELYAKAHRGGIREAKERLDALRR
ncbi:coiled-coil domain-containing protein [Bradyrhizobium sp. 5.13L]